MAFEYLRKINYYETDKMGVVHHSNYIRFLEEARCRWLEEKGISMELLESKGYTIPTLEIDCKYKYPVTSGDVIVIKPRVSEYNGVKMTIAYDVTEKETGKEVIQVWTKHCFTNMELRPINIKKYDETINKVFQNLAEEGGF